jgi:hypothetical protein
MLCFFKKRNNQLLHLTLRPHTDVALKKKKCFFQRIEKRNIIGVGEGGVGVELQS